MRFLQYIILAIFKMTFIQQIISVAKTTIINIIESNVVSSINNFFRLHILSNFIKKIFKYISNIFTKFSVSRFGKILFGMYIFALGIVGCALIIATSLFLFSGSITDNSFINQLISFTSDKENKYYNIDYVKSPNKTALLIKMSEIKTQYDLDKTILAIHDAVEDEKIIQLIMDNTYLGKNFGFGNAEELSEAISKFNQTNNKTSIYFANNLDAKYHYYVASSFTEIWLNDIGIAGDYNYSSSKSFYKDFFDKYKIKFYAFNSKAGKSYYDNFVRNKMSDEQRSYMTKLYKDLYGQFVFGISNTRNIEYEKAYKMLSDVFMTAEEAYINKLVTKVGDLNEFLSDKEKVKFDNVINVADYYDYQKTVKDNAEQDAVAVIYIDGIITYAKKSMSNFANTKKIIEQLNEAEADEKIKSIVLRINSPGGVVVYGDMVYDKLKSLSKPLVISVADMAASGGYYLAAAGQKIIANKSSVIGSIGVTSGSFDLSGLLKDYKINQDDVYYPNYQYMSRYNKMSKREKKIRQKTVDYLYNKFVSIVTSSRKITGNIEELADGSVFTAKYGFSRGLVDKFGGLKTAILLAHQMANGLENSINIKLFNYNNELEKKIRDYLLDDNIHKSTLSFPAGVLQIIEYLITGNNKEHFIWLDYLNI